MKKYARRTLNLIISFLLIVTLTACSKTETVQRKNNSKSDEKAVKNEELLIEDIREKVELLTDVDIDSLKIIKRQTNESEMTDTVYVEISGINPVFECTISYVMNYSLYNEGWILDSVSRWEDGKWEITSLSEVPESTVEAHLPSNSRLDSISSQNVEMSSNESTVYYSYAEKGIYGEYLYSGYRQFEFNAEEFCYKPSGEFIENSVECVLYDTIVGEQFDCEDIDYGGVGYYDDTVIGKYQITIDAVEGSRISGHVTCEDLQLPEKYTKNYSERLPAEIIDKVPSFNFTSYVETYKVSGVSQNGHSTWDNARVPMGDIYRGDDVTLNHWFRLDLNYGIVSVWYDED